MQRASRRKSPEGAPPSPPVKIARFHAILGPMITLTEGAVRQLKHIQAQENKEGQVLRVSVIAGGCSGMSYKLDFVPGITDKDKVFEQEGIKIAIDPKSALFLKDMTLDYSSGLSGKGFEFHNPNAKKSCGCGTSFSA